MYLDYTFSTYLLNLPNYKFKYNSCIFFNSFFFYEVNAFCYHFLRSI